MKRTKNESKHVLLLAAGKLFAQKGIGNVTVTDIAKESGIDACMINRHFGGKEGLIDTVINTALDRWKEIDMRQYYDENKALLSSKDGQKAFVVGLVDSVFKTLGTEPNDDDPGKSMLMQLLQHPSEIRKKIIDLHIKPLFTVFYEIYKTITGKEDYDDAFCWFLILTCPQYVNTASPGMLDLIHPNGKIDPSFGRRLQFVTTGVLLSGLGLN